MSTITTIPTTPPALPTNLTAIEAAISAIFSLVSIGEQTYNGGKVNYAALIGLPAVVPQLTALLGEATELKKEVTSLSAADQSTLVAYLETKFAAIAPTGWATRILDIADIADKLVSIVKDATALVATFKK